MPNPEVGPLSDDQMKYIKPYVGLVILRVFYGNSTYTEEVLHL